MKRFNYLLEQTEIFSHFVQDGQLNKHTKGGGPTSPLRMKMPIKKQTSTNGNLTGEYVNSIFKQVHFELFHLVIVIE